MASADETSFVDANTSAVAGRVGRSDETRDDAARDAINAARRLDRTSNCWPSGTTSDVWAPAPPPPPAPMMMEMDGDDIVVTGARIERRALSAPIGVTALAESLSDLKLYRIPIPVTVAARSQKQVAFLANRRVSGDLIYRSRMSCCEPEDPELLYRFKNAKRSGLGEPLPAGKVILYQDYAGGRQFVGESSLPDKTVNEEVELVFGQSQGVTIETKEDDINSGTRYSAIVRNANPFAVRYELEFINNPDVVLRGLPDKVMTKPGKRVWATTLAANSQATLHYDVIEPDEN
jgi:hypothetical protein